MPLLLWEGDITTFPADAVVNAANESLLGGGGVDGAIHRAAGPELLDECKRLGGCETGRAKMTRGYRMPCRYIIHTVGPVWRGGKQGEAELLASCYRESLRLASESGCETVAFPLISSGAYGYPAPDAWEVAKRAILGYLEESGSDMTVTMVLLSRSVLIRTDEVSEVLSRFAPRYGAAAYASESRIFSDEVKASRPKKLDGKIRKPNLHAEVCEEIREDRKLCMSSESFLQENVRTPLDLEDRIRTLDESFSEMLLRKIDEAGITDAECYRRANIDRKLFSKIRSNPKYRPRKQTALAFAFALRLSRADAEDLLRKAGFALSKSSVFDVIVAYYLDEGEYDLFRVNDTLFAYDQALLGG
ncbi:MAG: O-acetyl-ADP-ribose deacetylase [Clostridia bacterium]|nr:O-acetyl-ADP-ribose deacetylase [Clostridia bacterium]